MTGARASNAKLAHTRLCGRGFFPVPNTSTDGRYQNAKAQCIACGAGTYGDQAGQVAVGIGPGDRCKNCGVGRYSSALCATATTQCNACPAGKASNAAGQTVASADIDCNTGQQYSANEGSAACINCGVGLVSQKRPANPCASRAILARSSSWPIRAPSANIEVLLRVRALLATRRGSLPELQEARAACTACEAGKYGDQAGQVAVETGPGDGCKNCGVGR